MAEAAPAAREPLPSVFPGRGSTATSTSGSAIADDHRAWGQLAAARAAFEPRRASIAEATRQRAARNC